MPAKKVPAAVRAEARKTAGKDAPTSFERKTLYLYEIHFKKGDRRREMIFTADGRTFDEHGAYAGRKHEEDEGDKDEDD
jgi:hypothetical protein